MKAVIKDYYSIDVEDLVTYEPIDASFFGFNLQFILGPDIESKRNVEEIFNLFVCTPSYISTYIEGTYPASEVIFGRPLIFVRRYDFKVIFDTLIHYISSVEGDTWEEVAMKVGLIAQWEFENYNP